MHSEQIVKTTCGICQCGCGVLVHLDNVKPLKIEGDLDSPVNKGILCTKGVASLEYLNHSDRLKHPLRREGERGEGKWERVFWDEALDLCRIFCTGCGCYGRVPCISIWTRIIQRWDAIGYLRYL